MPRIELLDCTLRDGAYIVNGNFGDDNIVGIIKKLDAAKVDIIECGWLKDAAHGEGSVYYHVPEDVRCYMPQSRKSEAMYTVMIDWDRYDLNALPERSDGTIDAIRMVFPHGKHKQALALADKIVSKGYRLFLQAANTLAYSDDELKVLAEDVNKTAAVSLSIVDTFGAMYPDDLERIYRVLDHELNPSVKLGFHSHNNQQLSFALCMHFLQLGSHGERGLVVDASLCGMGRGAGNATTELVANYLNRSCAGNYDMNEILDAIDLYLSRLKDGHEWGYSIPYFIAGIYCTHVNNIAYLRTHHKTLAKDMRIIIESIDPATRKKYDYDNLERIYAEYQNRIVDDEVALSEIAAFFKDRRALLLAPGMTLRTEEDKVRAYMAAKKPVVVSINFVPEAYDCDCYFFANAVRYQFAKDTSFDALSRKPVILTSNIRSASKTDKVVNFNLLAKLGWRFFDNGAIMALRLLSKVGVRDIAFAGFDGFPVGSADGFYANRILQADLSAELKKSINDDVVSMLADFRAGDKGRTTLQFVTSSMFS